MDRPVNRIALVLNPESFRNTRNLSATEEFATAFREMGESVLIGDHEQLIRSLKEWRDADLDLLVISGGDGTVQRLIHEMVQIWGDDTFPRLLLLHGGTAGVVAKETDCVEPVIALSILREAWLEKRPLPTGILPTLRVGTRTTLSFGLGAFRNVSAEYITYGGQVALSHIYLGARLAGSYLTGGSFARRTFLACPWNIRIDDMDFEVNRFTGLYASALRRLPVFKPLRELDCPENGFKVVAVEDLDRRTAARMIPPLVQRKSEGYPDEIQLYGARQLDVMAIGNEEIPYMADGEYYTGTGSLTVTAGPQLEVVKLEQIDRFPFSYQKP